jgi:hypothetical protein
VVVVNLVVKSPFVAISRYKKGLCIGADARAEAAIHADLVAEGVGFEPTVGSYPYSGLANGCRGKVDYVIGLHKTANSALVTVRCLIAS